MRIRFFAQGVPKGQPRPRAFSRGGHARVYDPGTAEGWKSCVAIAAKAHLPKEPMACPVAVALDFAFPRPKSHFGTGKRATERKATAPTHHVAKPDADNAAKAILDALTDLRMWTDDAAVVQLTITKRYAEDLPGCLVTITEPTK